MSRPITDPPKQIKANFSSGEYDIPGGLQGTSFAELEKDVRWVLLYLQDTDARIIIHAHTDTVGTVAENDSLSQKRAASAAKYMTDSIIWTGIGETPKALATDRVIAKGEGQKEAEDALKKKEPTNWKQLIGTKKAENLDFRRFDIEYEFG